MLLFARLVRALLGETAVADRKLACGPSLDVLGLHISFTRHEFLAQPMADKIVKWTERIKGILAAGKMSRGQASTRVRFIASHQLPWL